MSHRALVLALFALLVLRALTNLLVNTETCALLASCVTLFANSFTGQRPQGALFLRAYPLVIVACNQIYECYIIILCDNNNFNNNYMNHMKSYRIAITCERF